MAELTRSPQAAGTDILIGGRFGDTTIAASDGTNLVIGDSGRITASTTDDPEFGNQPITLGLVETTQSDDGGDDTITTGSGTDIVLGGQAGDTIVVGDGDNIVLGDNGQIDYVRAERDAGALSADTDASDIDLITTTVPNDGGADDITSGTGNDFLLGGTVEDTVRAGAGNDLVFGDHGEIEGAVDADLLPLSTLTPAFVYTAIDTQNADDGGSDLIFGEAGQDILLGQQGADTIDGGSQDDDLFGGHNVASGHDTGDSLDGGLDNDVIVGDNASVLRRGDFLSPRMRATQGTVIYGEDIPGGTDGVALVTASMTLMENPLDVESRTIEIFDHSDTPVPLTSGDDYIAGGAQHDVIFGQLGDDIIQGDGSLGILADGTVTVTVGAERLLDGTLSVDPSMEDSAGVDTDGDDYIEGNGGADTMFGNLGQDDIVGGSSDLYVGLSGAETQRPDGSDLIFGGAGTDIARNNDGDTSSEGHARDADVIAGDNANILRLVGTNGVDGGGFLKLQL